MTGRFLLLPVGSIFVRREALSSGPGESSLKLDVVNPFDQSVLAQVAYDADAHVSDKLDAASAAFKRWRRLPLDRRAACVRAGLARLRDHRDGIER